MPTETLYFRNDQHTINTITGYKCLVGNSSSALSDAGPLGTYISGPTYYWAYYWWDVDVFIVHSDGSTDQIDTTKTVVSHACAGAYGYFYHQTSGSNTITCPQTSISTTDAINFRIKMDSYTGGAVYYNMITPQLGATKLEAAVWTIYLYGFHEGAGGPAGWAGPASYVHGGLTFTTPGGTGMNPVNSRVEGFSYETSVANAIFFGFNT